MISDDAPVIVVVSSKAPVASFTTNKLLSELKDTNVAVIAVELESNPVMVSSSIKLPLVLSFKIIVLGKLKVGLGDASYPAPVSIFLVLSNLPISVP